MDTINTLSEHLPPDTFTNSDKSLTDEEKCRLQQQNKRLVPAFKAQQLEAQAQRHWDLFYKRNETNFFKDRRWTTREFEELCGEQNSMGEQKRLLEVGCGVGNLIYPLIEEQLTTTGIPGYYFYACDFSPRAIEFVRAHALYNEEYIKAFQCDITTEQIFEYITEKSLDIVTMIFVLSAIHPEKFAKTLENLYRLLKPGGMVLFRDYGRYDMAQLRFKAGHKIAENFYMRQDGTRSYFFAENELRQLFEKHDFEVQENAYVQRRTLNVKEGIDVPRIFLQGKFKKK